MTVQLIKVIRTWGKKLTTLMVNCPAMPEMSNEALFQHMTSELVEAYFLSASDCDNQENK